MKDGHSSASDAESDSRAKSGSNPLVLVAAGCLLLMYPLSIVPVGFVF